MTFLLGFLLLAATVEAVRFRRERDQALDMLDEVQGVRRASGSSVPLGLLDRTYTLDEQEQGEQR